MQWPAGPPLVHPSPDAYTNWREWAEDLVRHLTTELSVLRQIVNGRLTLGDGSVADNIEGVWLTDKVTDATPDTETIFDHNIGRVPVGLIVVARDKGGVLYKGATSWTTSQMSLKCTVASMTFTALVIASPSDQL